MDFEQFRFTKGSKLGDFKTRQDAGMRDNELKALRNDAWQQLGDIQQRLYAESKQSLLVVLQAMDAAGKDSTIAKLTTKLDSHSCDVHSFKKPSDNELGHDFLWRVHAKTPRQGEITLFNRSHYEDVLIVKVHGWVSEEQIQARYQYINSFESLLRERGTRVLKLMLHISPEYQLERFKSRLNNPEKNWKFNPGDLTERAHWDQYMLAFEQAMTACSSSQAPWYVVPSENRRFRDLMVATLILESLQAMNPQYPAAKFDVDEYTVDSIS